MTGEDFDVDADVHGASASLTCRVCRDDLDVSWPVALAELTRIADAHRGTCTPWTPREPPAQWMCDVEGCGKPAARMVQCGDHFNVYHYACADHILSLLAAGHGCPSDERTPL